MALPPPERTATMLPITAGQAALALWLVCLSIITLATVTRKPRTFAIATGTATTLAAIAQGLWIGFVI